MQTISVNVEGALVLNPTLAFDTCETIKMLGSGSVEFLVCDIIKIMCVNIRLL